MKLTQKQEQALVALVSKYLHKERLLTHSQTLSAVSLSVTTLSKTHLISRDEIDAWNQKQLDRDEPLATRLCDLSWTMRLSNAWNRYHIETLGLLTRLSEAQLLLMGNMGRKSLQDVIGRLQALGLGLGRESSAGPREQAIIRSIPLSVLRAFSGGGVAETLQKDFPTVDAFQDASEVQVMKSLEALSASNLLLETPTAAFSMLKSALAQMGL